MTKLNHRRCFRSKEPKENLRDHLITFLENVPDTIAKDIMDMVLVTQYLDTRKELVQLLFSLQSHMV